MEATAELLQEVGGGLVWTGRDDSQAGKELQEEWDKGNLPCIWDQELALPVQS